MIGLDTNVLLRSLIDDPEAAGEQPSQIDLVQQAIQDSDETFYVNHVVLAETMWVLRNRAGQSKEAVCAIAARLLHASNIEVQDRRVVEAAISSFAKEPGDFADHLIGQINRAARCTTTLTFDRKAGKSPTLFKRLG